MRNLSTYSLHIFGVFCKIASLSCFCLLSLLLERKQLGLGSIEQFGVICCIGAAILFPIVFLFFRQEKVQSYRLYALRALLSILGMVTWIEALKNIESVQAVLFNYSTPIVGLIVASLWKAEKLNWKCVILGLISYIIIGSALYVEMNILTYGVMMAAASSIAWAFYEVVCKKQTAHEHFVVQVFYTFAFSAIMLSPWIIMEADKLNIDNMQILTGISVIGICNVMLLFLSIKFSTLNWNAPIAYMEFPVMSFWAYMLYQIPLRTEYIFPVLLVIFISVASVHLRKKELAKSSL
jgi:drug/metabolite transporter (DMT)-like permease